MGPASASSSPTSCAAPSRWEQIPEDLKNATVAIEDQRFYKNDGVDLTGIFRSAVKDITHGSALQGGSTIAMQLMRNLYLGGDQHTLRQKIIEAALAIEYEEHHSKRSVLTNYLNTVPYGTVGGQTAIGVQAAARIFFDKPASELDLAQSALLAGLPQAPSQYNPLLDPSAARQRRNEVLSKMAQLSYISGAQAAAAEAAPLGVRYGNFYSQRREDFFFEYVREQLAHRYGAQTVAQGGLKVYTTIDLNMQRLARKAIANVLDEHEDPASAIVTLNPANGDIEAMAESQSYEQSQYNLAADGHRQPGSTFKAIDLADALSRGVDPNSTYYLSHTLEPGWLTGYPTYEVKTFEGTSLNKSLNLVSATLASDNTVYAQLAADLGERTITQMAYKMGVTTHLSSYPAEALGGLTLGVTPLEMADVYATLADGGWRNSPIAITKVVFPNGHVDENWGKPHRVKVLSEGVTSEETSILEQNVQSGTATRSAINCPTAAKTGTTSELVDAWLDGYTPRYSTVVWMGYPEQARLHDRRARRAAAGRLSAGGNLARVHVGGDRRQAMRAIPGRQRIRSPTRRSTANSRPRASRRRETKSEQKPPETLAEKRVPSAPRKRARTSSERGQEGGARPQTEPTNLLNSAAGDEPPPPTPAQPSPGDGTTVRPSGGAPPG